MNKPGPIPDFTEVTLKRAVDVQGLRMPAGAHGVATAAYADGKPYAVTSGTPRHAVVTLEGRDIRADRLGRVYVPRPLTPRRPAAHRA